MDRRLEATDMFYWHVLSIPRLQVLVQNGKDFIIQNLELANSFTHFL